MKNKQKQLKIEDKKKKKKKKNDALNTLKPLKYNKSDDNENLLKYKKIFEELSNKRIDEIQNMSKQIDFTDLIYYFTTLGLAPITFTRFIRPINIDNVIKNGETSIEKKKSLKI